jgi:uncharacterized membrane protein YhaH (DUF805 family)
MRAAMQGEILAYDEATGTGGQIAGADGSRYAFDRSDLRQSLPVAYGTKVDFVADGTFARDIYILPASVVAPPPVSPSRPPAHAPSQRRYYGPVTPNLTMWGYFTYALTTNFANFQGRARRGEYWSFVLFSSLIAVGLIILMLVTGSDVTRSTPRLNGIGWFFAIALIVYLLWALVPHISLLVRRCHDLGLTGWLVLGFYLSQLIPIVSFVTSIAVIVMCCIEGQRHDNQYGPRPPGA